jgi:hypothetical protein
MPVAVSPVIDLDGLMISWLNLPVSSLNGQMALSNAQRPIKRSWPE